MNPTWQTKVEGAYTIDRFEVDWDGERVRCPQGKLSSAWARQVDHAGTPYVSVMFRKAERRLPRRSLCTRAVHGARHLELQPRAEHRAPKGRYRQLVGRRSRRGRCRPAYAAALAPVISAQIAKARPRTARYSVAVK